MTKPARKTLSLRNAPVSVATDPVVTGATTYGLGATEIIFSGAAALICHQGVEGDTEATVAANIDELFGEGAFARLKQTGVFMKADETTLDEPSQMYSLSVDAAIVTELAGDRPAEEPETVEASDDGFVDDTVFQQSPVEAAAPAAIAATDVPAPEGEEVSLDLTAADITFATTKTGAPYATIRGVGDRTKMAFGDVAEAIRDQRTVSCIIAKGRSTDKIVAVRNAANDFVVEAARAA